MAIDNSPVCRNAKEIGRYIGVSEQSVVRFKKEYGLPVWRFNSQGNWRALKPSLDLWMTKMEKMHLTER